MKIKVKFKTVVSHNLDTALDFITFMFSDELQDKVKEDITSKEFLDTLQGVVDSVVQSEIYDKGSGGGTGNLRRSFKVMRRRTKDFIATVFTDPDEGVEIKAGKFQGSGSYGIFFLDPDELESFIKSDDPLDRIRFRPFYRPMIREIETEFFTEVLNSVRKHARRKAPRIGSLMKK